jgi:hypothetical protein
MKWLRRLVVLAAAIGLVVFLAYWWRSGFLGDLWGPSESGGRGRGGGLGLGMGMGRGGGEEHVYANDFGPVLLPLIVVTSIVVAVDMVRLRIKRSRRRAAIAA